MLSILVPAEKMFDVITGRVIETKPIVLKLEHSLIAISRWESKYHRPFLDDPREKTAEELLDHIRGMTINANVDPNVYHALTSTNLEEISRYIADPNTATTIDDRGEKKTPSSELVTSELIYAWMVLANIPFECERWHIKRLITLIRVVNIKNAPKKKMSAIAIMQRNSELNAARRKRMNSPG